MEIELQQSLNLFLIIPVGFILIYWVRQSKEKKLPIIFRSITIVLLVFSLAMPTLLQAESGENVIFLVDQSASMKNSHDKVIDFLHKSIENKGSDDSYSIIKFGKSSVLDVSETKDAKFVLNSQSENIRHQTNLEDGLHFASSLLGNKQTGRIVVLSDDKETTGHSQNKIPLLIEQNTSVDYFLYENNQVEDSGLGTVSHPRTALLGETVELNVPIESTISQNVEITVQANNQIVLSEKVMVKEGVNAQSFQHVPLEEGQIHYKVSINPERDEIIENNQSESIITVKGEPNILVVSGEKEMQLTNLLEKNQFLVNQLQPQQFPTKLSSLLSYDSIVFDNVTGTYFSQAQMELVERAVKDFGVGFLMIGGKDSFGLGGYFKTPIEKILPVDMDIKGEKELPSLGLVIVVDRSGSMSGNKLSLAKEAAARSVELLREKDTLGFIAFDDKPWEIVETSPIKDKAAVIEKIRSVTSGGGTEIYSSLELAYEKLTEQNLQRKHIILLTDGQSATHSDYDSLIEEGYENKITLSTVSIGTDADKQLLENLALVGEGRYYDVTEASVIPSILSRETVMATRTYIEDTPFYPSVTRDSMIENLFGEGIPEMNAYIATTPKQASRTSILSEKEDPILSYWQYGLGTTFAFTSDSAGEWAGDWARWKNWPRFWNNVMTASFPSYEEKSFGLVVGQEGEKTKVKVSLENEGVTTLTPKIIAENGEEILTDSKISAPGEYEIELEAEPGLYYFQMREGDQLHYQTGFSVPYSEEYRLFPDELGNLAKLASATGGKKLIDTEDVFRDLETPSFEEKPISSWFVLMAMLLFFLEIVYRRVGFSFLKKLRFREKKLVDSKNTEQVEQLMLRKSTVEKRVKNKSPRESLINRKLEKEPFIVPSEGVKKEVDTGSIERVKEEKDDRIRRLLIAKQRRKK
ncbi:VWA domain-containing protein [Bacillus sp. 2205SS5-2]|uniref:VWA domain-containing protein n=1 Tax=Bacillus sp. 2205SS5-2 TaxID=3109031 RepID=UPI003005D584